MAALRVFALTLLAICALAPSANSATVPDEMKPVLRAVGDLCQHVFNRNYNFKQPDQFFQGFYVSDFTNVLMQSLAIGMGQSLSYTPYLELQANGAALDQCVDDWGNNTESVNIGRMKDVWTTYLTYYYMSETSCRRPYFPTAAEYAGYSKPLYHAAGDLCDFILNPKRFDPTVFTFPRSMSMHDATRSLFEKLVAYMQRSSIPTGSRTGIDTLLNQKDLEYTYGTLRTALVQFLTNYPDPNTRGFECWQPYVEDKFASLLPTASSGCMNKATLAAATSSLLFGLLRQ